MFPYFVCITEAEEFSPELVRDPLLLLSETSTLHPVVHCKTEGKVLQSLFERGLYHYTTAWEMSGHESPKGQPALVIRVPRERRGKHTGVLGHAVDRATKEEAGQKITLATRISRKTSARRTIRSGGFLAKALRCRCWVHSVGN